MSFARNILRDLVEKRLWPVALLMVVAIVAIPVLGGGGSKPAAGEDSLPIAPGAAANASSTVELLGPASVRKRAGKVVDPFRRKAKKDDAETGVDPDHASDAGTGAAGDAKSSGSGGTTAPATGGSTAPSQPSLSVYRTTVRWSAEEPTKARRIARLTPLGGVMNPAVLYLGVERDGKHALFLLGPDATSVGEGECRETSCRVIALGKDDTQIIDLEPAGAAPTQFELELVFVKSHKLGSAAKAAAARGKLHPDGRDVLRSMIADGPTASAISGFGYDRVRGVMSQRDDTSTQDGG